MKKLWSIMKTMAAVVMALGAVASVVYAMYSSKQKREHRKPMIDEFT